MFANKERNSKQEKKNKKTNSIKKRITKERGRMSKKENPGSITVQCSSCNIEKRKKIRAIRMNQTITTTITYDLRRRQ